MAETHPTLLRIIDANFNRAREALRVMEEHARLVLDDAALTEEIKAIRHALAEAVGALNVESSTCAGAKEDTSHARADSSSSNFLLKSRDILGDVGCRVRTSSEYVRASARDVVLAAGRRAGEALRTLEEYGKTLDVGFAESVETIRYRVYEAERRLHLTVDAQARFAQVRLYVIITESLCAGDWLATAEAALRGGANCLQLREKSLPDRVFLERARRLVRMCRRHNALCIINDRPDLAALAGADGVHLGQDDVAVAAARRILPPHGIVGLSTHTLEQLEAAAATVPDYVAIGPMFATPSKPSVALAGPKALTKARRRTSLPLVAIGGIDERNVEQILSAAPAAICVCRAVIAQPDPHAAATTLRAKIDQASVAN